MRNAEPVAKGTILIVDDSTENVQALSELLRAEGYQVSSAGNGEEGLRLALEQKPDLVVLDLILPGMLGIEVLDALKREQPETGIILTTAFGSEETAVQAWRHGAFDYIINKQPFKADEVREVVRRALTETQLRRDNLRLQRDLTLANQQLKEYSAHLEHSIEELRAANERQKELNRSRASFISIVSHELRHPLTVAKGYLELVTSGNSDLDPETRGFLDIAEDNLKNLAKMLDDLLDLSRMEAGHYHIDRQTERVAPLINQTFQAMNAAAQAKGIRLQSELSENLPLVSADPLRITQVLCNLVDNAIKFTPSGGSITLSAQAIPHEVAFTVIDTGIGVPASELGKIFERFYQIKNPAQPTQEGAGLGLAICREIIRLHGGQIWATSQEGQGSQFHFTLPAIET